MPARTFIGDSGATARLLRRWFVGDSGGVARELKRVFIGDSGGVARQIFQNAIYSVYGGNTITASAAGVASSQIIFETDGDIVSVTTGVGSVDVADWIDPKSLASSNYTIRASHISGPAPTGSALDTDLDLGTVRSWTHTQSGVGDTSCVLTLTLKDNVGNTLVTGDVTLRSIAF